MYYCSREWENWWYFWMNTKTSFLFYDFIDYILLWKVEKIYLSFNQCCSKLTAIFLTRSTFSSSLDYYRHWWADRDSGLRLVRNRDNAAGLMPPLHRAVCASWRHGGGCRPPLRSPVPSVYPGGGLWPATYPCPGSVRRIFQRCAPWPGT